MLHRRIHFGLIVRCCALLLLGAVITVGAAWAPAVWPGFRGGAVEVSVDAKNEEFRWWRALRWQGLNPDPDLVYRITESPLWFDAVELHANEPLGGPAAIRWRSGVPMRSLAYFSWTGDGNIHDVDKWKSTWQWSFRGGPRRAKRPIVLPLTPTWSGFVVDTLFYAALAAVILAGWRWMIRRGRLNRGLCPACRYPIGRSAVCSECGEGLVVRTDRSGGVPSQE